MATISMTASIAAANQPGNDLAQELRARGSKEGLAIVRPRTNWFAIIPFDTAAHSVRNPRDLSSAWVGQGGDFVVWNSYPWPDEQSVCSATTTIETLNGDLIWQVPGSITNIRAMALSADGQHLAFDGTYMPAASDSGRPGKPVSQSVDVYYVDVRNGKIIMVSPDSAPREGFGSISWSPHSDAFTFASGNRIYVVDTSTRVSKAIGEGLNPTWSPDGDWIAFRSMDGWATVISPVTFVTRRLLDERRILGAVRWSPDSRYVLVSESIGLISNVLNGRSLLFGPSAELVVYRLSDGARASVDLIDFKGGNDSGFDWVKNLKTFMNGASRWPSGRPCLQKAER